MALKTVDFKIKVDGKELDLAKTSVNQFNEVYSAASKKLNDLPLGSPEWKKLQTEIKNADTAFQQTKDTLNETEGKFKSLRLQIRQATVAFQEAEEKGDIKSMRKLKKDIDDLNDQFEITTLKAMKFEDALATMPGVAGFVGQSIQGIDKAFKVLVANPILALVTGLVGAFMFLKEALGKTKEGTAALNKVSQAFSAIMGPLLALINTVAVPIFEKLAMIITKVAGAFSFFAEKLGVSKASIAAATKDVDKVGQEAAENEKKRQEEAKKKEEEAAQRKKEAKEKAIKDAEDEKKRKQDLIKSNEDLKQSEDELARSKVKASEDPIQALKDEQKQKDEDFAREKDRIEKLKNVKGTTAEEQKQLQIELNNLEAKYNEDTLSNQKKQSEELVKIKKSAMDQEIADLDLKKAKGEIKESEYQQALLDINKKYLTDKKDLTAAETAFETYQTEQRKKNAEDERSIKFTKIQEEIDAIDRLNAAKEDDFEQDNLRLEERKVKIQEQRDIELLAAEDDAVKQLEIKKKYADELYNIDQTITTNTKAQTQQRIEILNMYGDVIGKFGAFLQQVAGDNKGLAKAGLIIEQAAGIAKIVINTQVNAAKAGYLSPKGIAEIVAGGIGVATAIAATIKGIKAIDAQDAKGSSSAGAGAVSNGMGKGYATGGVVRGPGSGTSDSIPVRLSNGEGVMTAQAVQMFGPLLSQLNQAGGGAAFNQGVTIAAPDRPKSSYPSDINQTTQIIKTYVVEGELTTAQQRQARLKDLSTI